MAPYTVHILCVSFVALASFAALVQCDASIEVDFTIINDRAGNHFHHSIRVSVPEGSVLLKVMEEAQKTNSQYFSFATELTSWGPYVTSINHLSGSAKDKTYWQFLSGKLPLDKGVGTYVPKDGEHIIAIFSTY